MPSFPPPPDSDAPASGRIAHGLRGAAAAGHPTAALAGVRMLEAGGTAVDACLAMAATSWVVMPDMCGPGGDLFALWREPGGELRAVTGAGRAPAGFRMPESADDRAGLVLIPGAPAAVRALRDSACRLDLRTIFAPAVAAASSGFVVGARFDRQLQALPPGPLRSLLAAWNGGRVPRLGERFRIEPLGRSLAEWAEAGEPGAALAMAAAEWRRAGAAPTADEIADMNAALEAPLALRLGAWTVYGQPPISQAVATLAALGIAGADAVRHPDGAYRDHLLIEAYKAAYRQATALGEGGDVAAQVAAMLDSGRQRELRESIGPRAAEGPPLLRNYGETTQCAAADADGRVCTLIHSLYRPFGARLVSESTGWLANDRGATFTDGPNAPAPGRRPRSTLVNLLAVHADGAAFALGTPGAQAQTQTTLQVLASVMRDPGDLWGAIAAPRWSFIGGRRVAVEAALPGERLEALEGAGHLLALRPPRDWLTGSVSLAAWRDGVASAVADPRREALALAI
jgi:gamma-glutamyltranspeptidase/glutathione hydrolase